LLGLVCGVPSLICLPLGVWIASHWGFAVVFVATAAACLLAIASVPWLPGHRGQVERAHGVLAGLTNSALMWPAAVFAASTMAAGVLVTFLPLAVGSTMVVTVALFVQPAASTVARWAAGRIGDRRGQARLLVPGIVLSAVGMAALAATHTPALVAGGAACFGIGFGILQNSTLAIMYAHGPQAAYSSVSAIWNAAYDAGMGIGATGVGLFAGHTGYPFAFVLTAVLVIPAMIPARRVQARESRAVPDSPADSVADGQAQPAEATVACLSGSPS
jgi:predicted MFS family arabinose efflux permease